MDQETLPSPEAPEGEVSMLIRALGDIDRRLEELTEGQVDTVSDRRGRPYLLRRAQDEWRQAEAGRQAAILNALPAHIVVLNADGLIVSANEPWRLFADANNFAEPNHGIGRNYLAVCDEATGDGATEAFQAAHGIRSVLRGAVGSFSLEYGCHSAHGTRWFLLTATPVADECSKGVVVMHLDVTARKRSEEDLRRFAAAMDATPDAVFLIDRQDMRMQYVNEAACRMHGLAREHVLALEPWKILNNSRQALEETYDTLIADGGFAEPVEYFWERSNAQPIWIEVRRHAQLIGGRWTVVILVRDVTARKQSDTRIAYLNRVYAVLSRINNLIVRVRDRNELFREACRIAVEDGQLAMACLAIVDRSDGKVALAATAGMEQEFIDAIAQRFDSHSLAAPGSSLPLQAILEKSPVAANDLQGDTHFHFGEMHAKYGIRSLAMLPLLIGDDVIGVLMLYARERGFFHDDEMRLLVELATDIAFAVGHIEKQERIDYLAYYDVLTGLANRSLFLERAAQYVRGAASRGHKLAMCLIDLERFKNVNDSLGRSAGDMLLRQVAQWLTTHAGDANIVARVDADRFAMILPEVTDEEEVARLLEKTLKAFLNHSFILNGTVYRISAKVGVALFPEDGHDADILYRDAEAALKKAKLTGDRYLFYTQKMTETVAGRLKLETQLRRALEHDEYVLHYQPKFNLANGTIVGAEALIRWNDPSNGLVPPGQFIPILEETGLIHEVGRWALRKAVGDYLSWRKAGLLPVRIAVNLSPLQLRSRDFLDDIQEVVGADPHAASGLELELTETLIMDDVKLSIARLQAVRAMGVRIAIDDFGTGFSSLSYLSKLPVDTVKIDRSFVVDMASGPDGLSLVSIIINLAHALKLKVVAEGVETEEQSRLLRLLNCDEIQGFLLSKPLPAALFVDQFLTPPALGANA